jgi:hypothetical protein
MDPQQAQADNEALASALSAISHPHSGNHSPHFHHPLTAPDFSHHKVDDEEVDVENLEIPGDDDNDLGFGGLGSDSETQRGYGGRPPSIRKGELCRGHVVVGSADSGWGVFSL